MHVIIILLAFYRIAVAQDCHYTTAIDAKSLVTAPAEFQDQNKQIRSFIEAGGSGQIVQYSKIYPDPPTAYTLYSGLYLIVQMLPEKAVAGSHVLWLRDPLLLQKLKKIQKRMPLILAPSKSGAIAAVTTLSAGEGLVAESELRRCGFLPLDTKFTFSISDYISKSVLVHESVHIDDFVENRVPLLAAMDLWKKNGLITKENHTKLRTFILEERAYTRQVQYLTAERNQNPKAKVLGYVTTEWMDSVAKKELRNLTTEDELNYERKNIDYYFDYILIPELQATLIQLRRSPIYQQLISLIAQSILDGPYMTKVKFIELSL